MRKRAKPSKDLRPLAAAILAHPEADPTEESLSEFLDVFDKGAANGNARTRRCGPRSDSTTEAIVAEMKGLGIGTSDLSIAFSRAGSSTPTVCNNITVEAPPMELGWTTSLEQYEHARQSAITAIMRLMAGSETLRCSYGVKSPSIEQSRFVIRAGLIGADHPSIPNLVAHAQMLGQGRTIYSQIADDLYNAERGQNRGLLSGLSPFRLTLCLFWIGFLFWQMSDENITKFMSEHEMFPAGFKANRPTVTEARNQLGLLKGPQQVVKSVGPNFHWYFKKGYPPQQQ